MQESLSTPNNFFLYAGAEMHILTKCKIGWRVNITTGSKLLIFDNEAVLTKNDSN